MEHYLVKLKHIVPTLLVITFGTCISLLIFRWVFTIETEILPIKEDVFNIWLPIILPWIPITIWLRPKIRIVKFEKGDASMLLQFITWGTMTVMMMVSNAYLKTATGALAVIKSIDNLSEFNVRYLKLDTVDLDRRFGSSHSEFRTSGRYNEKLDFDLYFVYPFKNVQNKKFKYWYGVEFQKQISSRLSNDEKERKYQEFFAKCVKDFESYKFSEPDFFEILPHSDDREGFLKAIKREAEVADLELIVIAPKDGLYSERNGKKLEWIFGSFGIGFGVFLFALIFPKYQASEHKRQLKGIKPRKDDIVEMLKYLIPKGEHFATSVILDLNILIFAIMAISGVSILSPNGLELLHWGANRRAEIANGEWWRLISYMFLHGGVMHLLLNVYGLVIAAIFVEKIFGRLRYFILYMVSGLCGGLASIFWYENTVSIGASGAIFGMYGSIIGLLLTNAFPKEGRKGIIMLIGPYVGINLLFGLAGGIDNAAHVGGLVSGAGLGLVLYRSKSKKLE